MALGVSLFISSLVYSGLSLSGNTYSTDPFLYMVISGLMEIPAYTITAPIINRWGRKVPSVVGCFMSGATILSLTFIPNGTKIMVIF